MSSSSTPRIVRKHTPDKRLTESTYRSAFDALMKDFGMRCAYSLVHVEACGGRVCMEIDHHNPKLEGDARHDYNNLFPATRHCNHAKSNKWPSSEDRDKGIRFLNPCEEGDYNVQIFEKEDGKLVGTTVAARYHIAELNLNADDLVRDRLFRKDIRQLITKLHISDPDLLSAMRRVIHTSIPPIDPPPDCGGT